MAVPDENRPKPIKLESIGGTIYAIFYVGGQRFWDEPIAEGTEAWPATEADMADAPKEVPKLNGQRPVFRSFAGWYRIPGRGILGKGLAAVFGAKPPG